MVKRRHRKKLTKPAFATSVARFKAIGFHPGLDPQGALIHKHDICPGQYDINKSLNAYKLKITTDLYTRQKITEEFSHTVGKRFPERDKQNKLLLEGCCPGDIPMDEGPKMKLTSVWRDLDFGRANRFKKNNMSDTPGPASYGKNHIPALRYEEFYGRDFGKVPCFEWDGFVPRGRNMINNKSLAPNRYSPKDPNSISVRLIQKVVSKRGPYDLFTGPRDATTMKNHFAPSTFPGSKTMFQDLPSYMNRLKHPLKANNGKFSTTSRFDCRPCIRTMIDDIALCYKDPNSPAPNHYDPQLPSTICTQQSKYPFNISGEDPRPEKKRPFVPGPGRYKQYVVKPLTKPKPTWQFKSKVLRDMKVPPGYNSF